MALLGTGVLAIWNGIDPVADADFVAWHVREHIPERVGLPGFLRGRRYVALDGAPAYFNFYETTSPAALTSPEYHARLNAPTPWTKRVVQHFRDTSRTVCDVAVSLGVGDGAWVETIRLRPATATPDFAAHLAVNILQPALEAPGIVAIHLLQGRPSDSTGGTAEKALRSQPDQLADWIMLIEAVDAEPLQALRTGPAATAALERHGVASDPDRGLYRLQYALTH
jgi:hypothetical protein